MSKSQRTGCTPGPWAEGQEGLSGGYVNIYGDPGNIGPIIGTVVDEEVGEQVCLRNARLIATAPELHECLRDLFRMTDPLMDHDNAELHKLRQRTERVLEKAMGLERR